MKVIVKLPETKFSMGDIVEHVNENNAESIFVHINNVSVQGLWRINNGVPIITEENRSYLTTVQPGSFYDSDKLSRMRPGTCLCFSGDDLEIFDVVKWEEPFVSIDTLENIDDRRRTWKE